MSDKLPRIQAVIAATEDVLQMYADKEEVKTIVMAEAYEHIRKIMGVEMFGEWVIMASHPSETRYSSVETSLGQGIALDMRTEYDIATDWKEQFNARKH